MDTEKYKSIALNMDTYKKLRVLSDDQFEMPQSLAKTASYFIDNAWTAYEDNKSKNAKRKA
jgi:hypothetical protein|tara:strand:- start:614 stop:796 length:183 start_codon:yes stop_codon:yes gene_type:complete